MARWVHSMIVMLLQTFLGTYRQRLEPAGGLMWSVDTRATDVSHTRLDRSATPARRLLSPYMGQVRRQLDHPNAHETRQPVVLWNLRWSDDGAWLETEPPWQ